MRLAIITINFNGSGSTLKLLKSLQEQTDKNFQIIVIDNASREADFNILKENIGGALLIRNDDNLGFSGGCNVGIRQALQDEVEWALLLNNDTWVEKGFISDLKAKLGGLGGLSAGKQGIVGIPLVEDGEQASYCGKIEWLKPTLKHIHHPLYTEQLRRHVNYYAIGGAMLIHRDIFDKIGFLDEKYFLYFEDADFSLKAQQAGFYIKFLEEPKVHHQVSMTTKKLGSPILLRYHYRNALYFNLKNGPAHIKFMVWPWSFWIMKKQLFKIMFMYRQRESLAILYGIFDFYRNKMGQVVNFSDAQKRNAGGN